MNYSLPIWYVDDNEADALIAQLIFEELCPGAPLQVFRHLRDFEEHWTNWLQKGQHPRPLFILMDLHFALGDSWETIRLVRQTHSPADLPVYLFTANSDPGLPQQAFAAGTNGFLRKELGYQDNVDQLKTLFARPGVM